METARSGFSLRSHWANAMAKKGTDGAGRLTVAPVLQAKDDAMAKLGPALPSSLLSNMRTNS